MWEFLSKWNLGGLSQMLRPTKAFERLLRQEQAPRMLLLQIFLAGIILVQVYADLFDLGDAYPIGKVMSVSLVLGPLGGLLLAVFGALFIVNLGCLLDSGHVSTYAPRNWRAPLPVGFLWRRIAGRQKVKAVLKNGWLKGYSHAWNKALNGISKVIHRIGYGRTGYSRVFKGVIRSSAPLLIAALVQLLEHIFVEDVTFTAAASSPISLVLKLALVAWMFVLWVPLARTAFQLSLGKAILTAASSSLLSIGLVLLVLHAIFAVPLQ